MTSPHGRHYSSWIDSRLQYVVRLESCDGSTAELTNVQETAAARQRARDASGHIRHGSWILRSTAMRGSSGKDSKGGTLEVRLSARWRSGSTLACRDGLGEQSPVHRQTFPEHPSRATMS